MCEANQEASVQCSPEQMPKNETKRRRRRLIWWPAVLLSRSVHRPNPRRASVALMVPLLIKDKQSIIELSKWRLDDTGRGGRAEGSRGGVYEEFHGWVSAEEEHWASSGSVCSRSQENVASPPSYSPSLSLSVCVWLLRNDCQPLVLFYLNLSFLSISVPPPVSFALCLLQRHSWVQGVGWWNTVLKSTFNVTTFEKHFLWFFFLAKLIINIKTMLNCGLTALRLTLCSELIPLACSFTLTHPHYDINTS